MCPLHVCIWAFAPRCASACVWQHSPFIGIDFSRRGFSPRSAFLSTQPPPSSSIALWRANSYNFTLMVLVTMGPALLQCKRWQSSIRASGRLPCPSCWRIPLSMGISGKLRLRWHGFQLTCRLIACQCLPPPPPQHISQLLASNPTATLRPFYKYREQI